MQINLGSTERSFMRKLLKSRVLSPHRGNNNFLPISEMNIIFSGYAITVPGMAGSWLSFLYYGAAIWAIASAAARRYSMSLPLRSLPFVVSGLAYLSTMLLSGLIVDNIVMLPKAVASALAFLCVPFLIARYRYGSALESWRMICRYAPLGAALGIAASLISGSIAAGAGNASVFGAVMAVLSALSLAGTFEGTTRDRLLALMGFGLGAAGILISGTRTLYPCILLLPCIAILCIRKIDPRILAGCAAILVAIVLLNKERIEGQWTHAVNDAQMIEIGRFNNSVGNRIVLWKASIEAIAARPVFGYGPQNKMDPVLALTDRSLPGVSFSHVHNAFLDTLVAGGIVAFIPFVTLLLTPLMMVFGFSAELTSRRFAVLSLLSIFVLFGVTGPLFTHDLVTVLFTLPLVIVAASDPDTRELCIRRDHSTSAREFGGNISGPLK